MESTRLNNMPDDILAKAMKEMGWDPAAHIPMANAENISLVNEINALMTERTDLHTSQQEIYKRVDKVHQHLKNAQICINHNLKLLSAYQLEVNSELHLFKIAEREKSKLTEELKSVNKEVNKYKDHVANIEKEFGKRKQSIGKLTDRIKWAKTALIEWREATEDSHKGTLLIEKYFKEDLIKAKQHEQRRQALQHEIARRQKILENLYEEQKCLERNLESTAKLYRSAHLERRQMVNTWKLAVVQMIQREHLIQKGEKDMEILQIKLKQNRDIQAKFDKELNDIIANNKEVEAAIDELNDETSSIKEQIQIISDMVVLKEGEVELLQRELQNLSNRVQQQRAENRNMAKQKQDKLLEIDEFGKVLEKLEERNKAMADKNLSAAQRLQILEEMNDNEQKIQNGINKEANHVNDMLYRAQHHLERLKNDKKTLEMANDALKVNSTTIAKNAANIEKELKRKVEIHYGLSFKCLEIEREIVAVQGGTLDPELENQNLELFEKLEEENIEVTRRLRITEAQNKKLDDNMRTLTHIYNDDNKELEKMNFQVKEAQVYCEGGIKRLKAQNHEAQVLIVDLSILKMRANDFENEIAKCNDSFYNLEKHRAKLHHTMKDRLVEIKSQLELLSLKKKHLEEEKSTLKADIGERTGRIKAARARFELTSKLLGTNEDGSMVTATQLRVETAQEKQLLLEEGNELNKAVLKAEEEVKAMENTLMLMNNSNENFRKNFQTSDDKDEALIELKQLQANYCKGLANLKNLRNKLLQVDTEMGKACEKKQELLHKLNIECEKRDQIRVTLEKLQKEIYEQKVKLQRADREVKYAIKGIKERAVDEQLLMLYNRDLDLKDIESRNMSVLNQLVDMAENEESIGPKIIKMILDKGLTLPQHLQKTRSMSSWRSDISDLSLASSRDIALSVSRSSFSEESQLRMETSSAVVSVVSIDFPG